MYIYTLYIYTHVYIYIYTCIYIYILYINILSVKSVISLRCQGHHHFQTQEYGARPGRLGRLAPSFRHLQMVRRVRSRYSREILNDIMIFRPSQFG